MTSKTLRRASGVLAAAVAAALVAVPLAGAHVRIDPSAGKAGAYTKVVFRVPNESDKASTVKLSVKVPAEVGYIAFQPKAGWTRTTTTAKTATGTRVATVTWTAAKGGGIAPGEFDEFGVQLQLPAKAGLYTFPAVQTYSDGSVQRWIAPQTADEPAPAITVAK